jgi:signal transduction histidine kinase
MIRYIIERKREQVESVCAIATPIELERLKSAFVDNISHEFRTPLNIILGYTDMIGEHLADVRDTSQDDCLDAVSRACKRLLRTFDAVLDYSKLESRSLILNSRTIILAPLIYGSIDEFRPAATKKGLRLTFEFEERALALRIDKYCFTNALRNLLENAIKFTETGSITVILARDQTGAIRLSVADTGIGIDRTFMPQLFEPFTQEDCGPARRFEGAGLGLALTRRYLELNGADLTVLSEKRRGSTFTIHFARPDSDASECALPFDDGQALLR